jgi:hypothetical protein
MILDSSGTNTAFGKVIIQKLNNCGNASLAGLEVNVING